MRCLDSAESRLVKECGACRCITTPETGLTQTPLIL